MHATSDIVTLDFETYYAKDYSLTLKAYNTSSYIRDPQFLAHCLGVTDGESETVWYGREDIPKALMKHAVGTRPICAHNAAFDGLILSEHYDVVPPFYYDTLSMARGMFGHGVSLKLDDLGQMLGLGRKPRACSRPRGCASCRPRCSRSWASTAPTTRSCAPRFCACFCRTSLLRSCGSLTGPCGRFCDPVLLVNQELALEEYNNQVKAREDKVFATGLNRDMLLSDEKLSDVLETLGVEVPLKFSDAQMKLVPAFSKQDKVFTDLLEHDNPAVVSVVEARLAVKSTIGETRAKRFVDIGTRTLPMAYNYCGAHTTRFSGGNKMNVQNLERGGVLRKSITAPPDHVICSVDSAQIEARLNAWLWGQENVLEAFRQGKDVYKLQAAQTYGKSMEEITKAERFVGKVQILGLGYGMGAQKFANVLQLGLMGPAMDVSLDQAYQWVNAYRASNDKISAGWSFLDQVLVKMALGHNGEYKCFAWEPHNGASVVWLPSGLPLTYRGMYVHESDKGPSVMHMPGRTNKVSPIWGGTMDENWVQALARCVITDQMLLVMDAGWRVVGMTHDEIISIAHKSKAERCLDEMVAAMRHVPSYVAGAPLNAEGEYGVHYS
jgi:DNA polymerase bacteriophage-type